MSSLQQPWTCSAYHSVAVTRFVGALQAEVRRQQDAFDHAAEVVHAGATSEMHELNIPLYGSPEEQLSALQETHALATLDTPALVALGPYRLLHTLRAHMTRIEDERRAAATAAGNCNGGATAREHTAAHLCVKGEAAATTAAASPTQSSAAVRVKVEEPPSAEERCGGEAVRDRPDATSESSPLPSTPTALAPPAKTELGDNDDNGRGAARRPATDLRDGCPPSWRPHKEEAAAAAAAAAGLPTSLGGGCTGTYLVPHPTPNGAPLARYTSITPLALSASSTTTAMSSPPPVLPTFVEVVRTADTAAARAAGVPTRRGAPSSPPLRRCRSASPSETRAVPAATPPPRRPSLVSMRSHKHVRLSSSPVALSSAHDAEAEDRVRLLWRRVWPVPSVEDPVSGEANTGQCHGEASPHASIRPTAAMTAALLRVAEQNYARDRERCAAQREYIAGLRETPTMPLVALRHLKEELAQKSADLDAAHARRRALLLDLADAIAEEAALALAPCGGRVGPPAADGDHDESEAEAAAASALRVLRASLADPALLKRTTTKARTSFVRTSAATASPAATQAATQEATASGETWELSNGIVGIRLPSLEDDANAVDLAPYLWPNDLDSRIRHELCGVVSCKSHAPNGGSAHVVLSATQVRRLEEVAAAAATSVADADVPPLVGCGTMSHPRYVHGGWLYVHGRGEVIVADVELR
ncbi:hypothetical protein NESM_000871200 [Novymonas esmeraldas]|uniref:Uncharacterized protein n=1 Tax=Novymonas esmeraldas TaxID=1808958 RepID=A0AAW0EXF0_9TRYP